jgi:predicted nucleic acid-binding protein
MASKPKSSSILVVMALGMVGFASLVAYVVSGNQKIPTDQTRAAAVQTRHADQISAINPIRHGTDLDLNKVKTDVPKNQDPIVFAVNEFLKNSTITPHDAVLVAVAVKDGLATLTFSEAFRQTYGATDEETLLKGITESLKQFPSIRRVQFAIAGQPMDTLGNVDLSQPLDLDRGAKAEPDTDKP